MTAKAQIYLIALGGNMPSSAGPAESTLRAAIARLAETGLTVTAVSRFFQTPCFPAGAGPDYVNAAAQIETSLPPQELLAKLHQIEAEFGRARTERWGMRSLDLDIIAAGSQVLPDLARYESWRNLDAELQRIMTPEELIVPHPRLAERAFVLIPLADIAPDWEHPVSRQSVSQMLAALPAGEKEGVAAL